jgi:hypothetical protein
MACGAFTRDSVRAPNKVCKGGGDVSSDPSISYPVFPRQSYPLRSTEPAAGVFTPLGHHGSCIGIIHETSDPIANEVGSRPTRETTREIIAIRPGSPSGEAHLVVNTHRNPTCMHPCATGSGTAFPRLEQRIIEGSESSPPPRSTRSSWGSFATGNEFLPSSSS